MLDKQTMEQLKFDEKGLIPAIVVDGTTGQVLTLAYICLLYTSPSPRDLG